MIVGKGGKFEKMANAQHGVRLVVDNTSRTVNLTGPRKGIEKVYKGILFRVDRAFNLGELTQVSKGLYDVGNEHFVMLVDKEFREVLRGPQDETLKRLYTELNVAIYIPDDSDERNYVTMCGPKQNVLRAERRITELIEDVEDFPRDEYIQLMSLDCYGFHLPIQGRIILLAQRRYMMEEVKHLYDVQMIVPTAHDNREIGYLCGDLHQVVQAYKYVQVVLGEITVTDGELIMEGLHRVVAGYYRFYVDPEHKGLLVGQGGENIKRIERTYNVSIIIHKKTDGFVTLQGQLEDVVDACQDISADMPQTSQRNYGGTGFPEEEIFQGLIKIGNRLYKMVLNRDERAMVIGRGGKNIKKLIADHNVRFQGPKTNDGSNECTIRGEEDSVIAFYNDALELIKNKRQMDGIYDGNDGQDE
ncbi:vigilin-like [Palaemon carinicauda]|uniref:vigilin-like n=1 Tax=Palaemon carinicauda TaxID=392227 RepID=UPI0035B59CEC